MNKKWSEETMRMINDLTKEIKGKSFDPGWFLLRQRLEEVDALMETMNPSKKTYPFGKDE